MPERADSNRVLEFGSFRLDVGERRLDQAGTPVPLNPKTFDLLVALTERAGKVVSKSELLDLVWPDVAIEEGALTVNISLLRRALGDDQRTFIETVPKLGYRFIMPVREVAPSAAVEPLPPPEAAPHAPRGRRGATLVALAVIVIAVAGWLVRQQGDDDAMRSIAALPFTMIQAEEDSAYLTIGMADAVIARLTTVAGLRVLPTAAIRHLADDRRPPGEIGRSLGVDGVVTGTLQRSDGRLRANIQLTRARDGFVVWTAQFEEPFTDIFSLQDAIARRVVGHLPVAGRMPAAWPRATTNIDAYERYLRGRESWAKRTREDVRTAVALFEQAVTLDPQFALAYAGLADAYAVSVSGWPPHERFPKARAAAQRAMDLDPALAAPHNTLAFVAYKVDWAWEEARQGFERSLSLDPEYALAHHWFGEFLGLLGRHDDSIRHLQQARDLDWFSMAIRTDLAAAYQRAGRLDAAEDTLRQALLIAPNEGMLLNGMRHVLEAQGRSDEAFEYLVRQRMVAGVTDQQIQSLRATYARGGWTAITEADLPRLVTLAQQRQPFAVNAAGTLAMAYLKVGDTEQGLAWLAESMERREDTPLLLRTGMAFNGVRQDPRFVALLNRLAMPAP